MPKRQVRLTVSVMLIFVLLLLVLPGNSSNKQPVVMVDGIRLQTVPAPILKKGVVFLPSTAYKKLGFAVKTGKNHSVWIGWPASEFGDKLTNKTKFTDGTPSPFIYKKALFIPLRVIVDGQIMKLEWDSKTNITHVKIDKSWKQWRIKSDSELRYDNPKWYETPVFIKG